MPTSVRLDSKTETLLRRIATRTGRTKSEVLRDAIVGLAQAKDVAPGASLLDSISDLVGIESGGPPDLARRSESEEVFRARLLARRRAR